VVEEVVCCPAPTSAVSAEAPMIKEKKGFRCKKFKKICKSISNEQKSKYSRKMY
jgi:hypothetical protein